MTLAILLLKRVFFGSLCILLGYLALRYTAKLMMWFGFSDWAENVPGGTGFVWKLVGVLLVAIGIAFLFGGFSSFGY